MYSFFCDGNASRLPFYRGEIKENQGKINLSYLLDALKASTGLEDYLKTLAKVNTLISKTEPRSFNEKKAYIASVNCLLPVASAVLTRLISSSVSGNDSLLYSNIKTVLILAIPILAEQLRVNVNRYQGRAIRDDMMAYLFRKVYGTDPSNVALNMGGHIPEFAGKNIANTILSYAPAIGERAVGYSAGVVGNLLEIICTCATLYAISDTYRVPLASFAISLAAAYIVRILSLETGKITKRSADVDLKGRNALRNFEKSENLSTLVQGSQFMQDILDEKKTLTGKEAIQNFFSSTAGELSIKLALQILQVSLFFLLDGKLDEQTINNCGLQGTAMLGSFRRLVGFLFEDKANFMKAIEQVNELLAGIDRFEAMQKDINNGLKVSYTSTTDLKHDNTVLRLEGFNFCAYDGKERLKNYLKNGDANIKKYQEALKEQDLLTLSDCNFSFEKGKIYKIDGETGTGKTSLLKALEGYWPMASGNLFFGCQKDEICSFHKSDLEVLENCSFIDLFVYPNRFESSENKNGFACNGKQAKLLMEILADLKLTKHLEGNGISHSAKSSWGSLSTGEQARVVIGRILMSDKPLKAIFLDEVTSNMDVAVEKNAFDCLRKRFGKDLTIFYIRHQNSTSLGSNYDKIVKINPGSQKLEFCSIDLEEELNNHISLSRAM